MAAERNKTSLRRNHRRPQPRARKRIASKLCLNLLIAITTFMVAPCGVTPLAATDATSRSVDETTTLVIMAPSGPVLAQLRVLIDGKSYRLWVAEFLGKKLDLDGDGKLGEAELNLIPNRLQQQIGVTQGRQVLRRVARDESTSVVINISTNDFSVWFADRLSRDFNIIAGAVKASEAVRLAHLIDLDGDGGIVESELQKGNHSLRFRDLDNDQTFSAAELMPFRDPRNQQAAVIPDVANLPFIQLTDEASIIRTATQIVKRYGNDVDLTISKLRLPATVASQHDADADGHLTADECRHLLASPDYHLSIDVLLSDRSNASDLSFSVHSWSEDFCRATAERRGRAKLVIDDMPVQIRARGGSTNSRSFFTSMLGQRFSIYDADRNNYLTADEFPPMQAQMAQNQIMATFETVDLNHDSMVMRDEITGFIERDAISTQSKIEVTVKQDGKTLFGILDTDVDRRLTPREFKEGFPELQKYDLNNDGQLMEQELGTSYVLEIGLAQSDVFRVGAMGGMAMMNQSTDAVLPGLSGLSGPEWFRRMDRNQDHDVSAREFLGPIQVFKTLDIDADGLLNAAEAEALN